MVTNEFHHLYKRGSVWYFRKVGVRFSLETTILDEALELRKRLLENFRLHGHFRLKATDEGNPTFGQVAKLWAKLHAKRIKYSTWRDYRSSMNTHLLPAFKDMPIKEITYLDVETFIDGLSCGPKRANNILVPMRAVFKMAYKLGYVSDNVMLKVDNLPVEQPDVFPLTDDEVLAILDAVDPFYRPYTSLRFFTGMRTGEIDGLAWVDFKEEMAPRQKLHINKSFVYGQEGKTKTKKSKRYIDCLLPVVEALNEQKRLTGKGKYIFQTKEGDRMNPDHFRNVVWKQALKKAGLRYRAPIQTRHTFATLALSKGEDIGWVQNMLGHSSLQMIFTRYYAWIPQKTRNDGAALTEAFREAEEQRREEKMKIVPEFASNVIELFDPHDTKVSHQKK
ncbi:MAG: site-specific integrase [Deltaproteobacteria bacterium]|nr:site-specific integrase [Deltaproteobacteria bacterium]